MRMSTVILPVWRWARARAVWRRAEQLGCHAAYTYDHLSWRGLRDGPWFGAVPTLTAAAVATERMRLGTLVTSPNFRHPVPLAKDLMSLDDVCDGRLTVGLGAGGTGFDATVLGGPAWSPAERADRFAEFVPLLDRLLREPATTVEGRFYDAHEARMVPGCRQRPRPPFCLAATGPRGLALTARYGQAWVTTGPAGPAEDTDAVLAGVADQLARLRAACRAAERDPDELDVLLLTGFLPGDPATSFDAFVDRAGRLAEAGVGELVVHWPIPDSPYAMDQRLFERLFTDLPGQLPAG